MSDGWDWQFTDSAKHQFDSLDDYAQERITSKLEEIVTDQWRDPPEYLEPLRGVPHDKLRVGPFRLGCRADREAAILYVLALKKRGGNAYRGDDD
jgi:mRNA interferase RelE/StbE